MSAAIILSGPMLDGRPSRPFAHSDNFRDNGILSDAILHPLLIKIRIPLPDDAFKLYPSHVPFTQGLSLLLKRVRKPFPERKMFS